LRKIRNKSFDHIKPRAVVMAESVEDVRLAVQWAVANKVPNVPRGGGHSYTGQSVSEGLVVSLIPMSTITLDKPSGTAAIGAGALLSEVNIELLQNDRALPTGSCASVGVAGLTLGGGVGFSSRKWGLMCDNLIGVSMVLASGELVHADERTKPELLWACRGGGGGQFGIVTEFRFRTHAVEPIAQFSLNWPLDKADDVIAAWQKIAPHAPDERLGTARAPCRTAGPDPTRLAVESRGCRCHLNPLRGYETGAVGPELRVPWPPLGRQAHGCLAIVGICAGFASAGGVRRLAVVSGSEDRGERPGMPGLAAARLACPQRGPRR
jgi:FAD/FMN-containing dehydrogenase